MKSTSNADPETPEGAETNAASVRESVSAWSWPRVAWLAACVAFAAQAFGPLLTFEAEESLSREFEGIFFQPSDTSPAVVGLLAAWLLYRRWRPFQQLPAERGPAWLWAGLLALAGATLGWAVFVGADDLRAVALMLTLQGFACFHAGPRAMRLVAVPTLFLVFVIPMPAPLLNYVLAQMQFWTAEFSGFLLHLIGQSAFVSGDMILREDQDFAIIETCSGVRISETLTMLTIVMLDLFRRSPLHSALMLALAPIVAFVFNGLRAVTLMLNPLSEVAEIHTGQGIAMLLGGLLVLYTIDGGLGRLLSDRATKRRETTAAANSAAWSRTLRLATAVLAAWAAVAWLLPPWQPADPPRPSGLRFIRIEGWRADDLRIDYRFLGRIGAKQQVFRRLHRGPDTVDLYIAHGDRSERARSVLFSKAIYPGSGWNTRDHGLIRLAAGEHDPEGIDAIWRESDSMSRRFLVMSWHEEARGLLRESLRSLLGLDSSPFRAPGEELTVRISTRIDGPLPADRDRAEQRLLRFHAELRPVLDEFRAGLHTSG